MTASPNPRATAGGSVSSSAIGVRVTVTAGPSVGASAVGRKIRVGRGASADLTLADPSVAEHHVELRAGEHGVSVLDLDSASGTIAFGVRIGQAVVPTDTELTLGDSAIRVEACSLGEGAEVPSHSFRTLLGSSAPMQKMRELLERLAPTDLAVFIEGPTGSGKELVARAIHDASPRAARPFMVLDCTSLPASLAEAVLFGHAAGAFTGAVEQRMGVFEAADGGTVFLDEVGDLPVDLQPKLLRVLEQQRVTRIGENRARSVSVRVVSATWRSLRTMVSEGGFRDDLYFRLAQTRVVLPALAERKDDIEVLVTELLRRLPKGATAARTISKEALAELATRDWPGNVRELKNTIERAAYMASGSVIQPQDLVIEGGFETAIEAPLSSKVLGRNDEIPEFKVAKRTVVDDFERSYLERIMAKTNGNIAMAAGLAGIERHYLRSLLKKHGKHSRE